MFVRGGRGYHRDGEDRREYSQYNRDQGGHNGQDRREYSKYNRDQGARRDNNEGPSGQEQGGYDRPHRGRGGSGRPPRGLRGRDIGMYYAKKSQEKKKRHRTVAHIPHKQLDMFEDELESIMKEQVI